MFLKDNISYETQQEFDIGYDEQTNRITIPIFSEIGDLVGVKGRIFKEELNEEAPKYVEGQDRVQALKAFEYALKQQYLKEDGKYAVIGSTISLPSFKDLVYDNNTAYEKLTYEVRYATPSSSSFSSSSSLVVNLSKEGDYVFYVMFKDVDGNAMDEDLFVKEQDGVKIINNDADAYGQFVFKFHIENNADIEIIPASTQGKGWRGIRYTASSFKIDASGCTITYKLFYNPDSDATKDSSGWVEIPSFKSVEDDTDYFLNGYSYEDLKSINYDGEVKFTPNKIGAYRIDCTASSNMTVQEVTESSEIIKIAEEKVVVRPGNNWLKNNAWSVVFLSVGSLCLVGIIVLLCVKPKEERKKRK